MSRLRKRRIKFGRTDEYLDVPKPAATHVPGWYKKLPKYLDGGSKAIIEPDNQDLQFSNKSVKHCIPFLDSLTTGYVAELWQDVQVVRTKNGPQISWPVDPPVLSSRSSRGLEEFPVPNGCVPIQFVWLSPYVIETPPGYSILVTHPLNRFDLPFVTLSAVVDSDSLLGAGHIPFYLKDDFEGLIKAGTPMYQIIPFKRDSWTSEVDQSLVKKSDKKRWNSLRVAEGVYRDFFWQKKSYE